MNIGGDSNSQARPLPAAVSSLTEPSGRMTLELATQMLPLVSRIASDLRDAWKIWRVAVTTYDAVMAALDADGTSVLARDAQREVRRRAADIEALSRELEPLGAMCRSPRSGRIEWNAVIDASPVRLLWEPDEPAVTRFEQADTPVFVPDESDDTDPSRS
jgi:hypothetical protein